MVTINRLYPTWFQRVRQLWPDERVTRLRNLAWLIVGIYQSRSVQLNKVAGKIPGSAKLLSAVRRLSRWLDNPAVRVREWYAPVARGWLQFIADSVGEIRLIADGTKVGFGHQLLIIAVAFRRRAIPIAWTWVKGTPARSSAAKQLALLAHVRGLLPKGVPILLVGDSEFGAIEVLRQLETWKWKYVLRQPSNHRVKLAGQDYWQAFGNLVHQPGQSRWFGHTRLTAQFAYPVNLLAHWEKGEAEPWLLATNLSTRDLALRAYRRRMWIEEMFGDMKKHGFDLESTHLRHFLRLSRLTLAVALLYIWLMSVGSRSIKQGYRPLVDRKERRDLSLFQIGWRIVERWVTNALAISIPLCPST
jgi:hypothetical protein